MIRSLGEIVPPFRPTYRGGAENTLPRWCDETLVRIADVVPDVLQYYSISIYSIYCNVDKGVGRKISRGEPTEKRLKNSKKKRKIALLSLFHGKKDRKVALFSLYLIYICTIYENPVGEGHSSCLPLPTPMNVEYTISFISLKTLKKISYDVISGDVIKITSSKTSPK